MVDHNLIMKSLTYNFKNIKLLPVYLRMGWTSCIKVQIKVQDYQKKTSSIIKLNNKKVYRIWVIKIKIVQTNFRLRIRSKSSWIESWIRLIRIIKNSVLYLNKLIPTLRLAEKYHKILPGAQN